MTNSDDQELAAHRKEIDNADREIVRLILRRTEFAGKIGELKRARGAPVYRPDREREVYRNIVKYAREIQDTPVLSDEALINVYREIMSGSIAVESGPAIAFLGPPSSFSHLACRMRFGSSMREVPQGSIAEVFRTVEAGRDATYGIVPVDNTTEGSVGLTLDMLLHSDLKIYAEQYIRVNHNLLFHENIRPALVRKLYTNKIAMEQCRNWIQKNLSLSEIEIVETPSTAAAAAAAAERKDGAAIASDFAAQTYNLKIIGNNIEDSNKNVTRFLVIGYDQCPPTGDDKTSIICSVKDAPGNLFRLLQPFYEAEVNLTRIESRASRRSYGDYNFFVDFLGHQAEERIQEILKVTASHTTFLKLLGSYPSADMP